MNKTKERVESGKWKVERKQELIFTDMIASPVRSNLCTLHSALYTPINSLCTRHSAFYTAEHGKKYMVVNG